MELKPKTVVLLCKVDWKDALQGKLLRRDMTSRMGKRKGLSKDVIPYTGWSWPDPWDHTTKLIMTLSFDVRVQPFVPHIHQSLPDLSSRLMSCRKTQLPSAILWKECRGWQLWIISNQYSQQLRKGAWVWWRDPGRAPIASIRLANCDSLRN